jgi:hypothetical protein
LLAALRLFSFGVEQADDAVGIADGRDLWIGHYYRGIRKPHCEGRAPLDPGRTVANDPIEFVAHFLDDTCHPNFSEGIFVPSLRSRKQPQRL